MRRLPKTAGDRVSLGIFGIVSGGMLLCGSTVLHRPAHAGGVGRTLPRVEHPAEADPCKGAWPYIVRSRET